MNTAKVSYISQDFKLEDFENALWEKAPVVEITRYWSGDEAEAGRQASFNLVWTEKALMVRFDFR